MLDLSTINGFDLLLVIVIISLVIRVRLLNRECEDYVGQIIKASWEIQDLKKGSQLLSNELREHLDLQGGE
jgi:hypothetical protein